MSNDRRLANAGRTITVIATLQRRNGWCHAAKRVSSKDREIFDASGCESAIRARSGRIRPLARGAGGKEIAGAGMVVGSGV
jgi:hypothetical protein